MFHVDKVNTNYTFCAVVKSLHAEIILIGNVSTFEAELTPKPSFYIDTER